MTSVQIKPIKTLEESKKDIDDKIDINLKDDERKTDLQYNIKKISNNYEVITVNINPKTLSVQFTGYIKMIKGTAKYHKSYNILFIILSCSRNTKEMFTQMTEVMLEEVTKDKKKKKLDINSVKDTSFGRSKGQMSIFLDKSIIFSLNFSEENTLTFTNEDLIKHYEKNKHVINSFLSSTTFKLQAQPHKITTPCIYGKDEGEELTTKISLTNFKIKIDTFEEESYPQLCRIFKKGHLNQDQESKYYKKNNNKKKSRKSESEDNQTSSEDE